MQKEQRRDLVNVPKLSAWKRLRIFLRAIRQFGTWIRRLETEEVNRAMQWHGARILIPNKSFFSKDRNYYPIFSPVEEGDNDGLIQRTHRIFDHHSIASYTQRENGFFIECAKGKKRFLDIGAAEGFYSALFAAISGPEGLIVSVDPMDPTWTAEGHLESVRSQNSCYHETKSWQIEQAYVTNEAGTTDSSSNIPSDCKILTLEQICQKHNFTPDFIKFDIESWEQEVLLSSIDYLKTTKPDILLELHGVLLRERGFSPSELIETFTTQAGYRVTFSEESNLEQSDNCHVVLEPIPS